ncbi:MAG: insulinase family protein, partial [Candidatus Eisenbacteria bacterium]|nr:insulinase family protein [Candidatus Eisenbacteria bacterium]
MTAPTGCPEPTFRAGDEANGFRITRVTPIPEIRVTAYEAVHLATGAKVLHLHCDDRENWYAVTFRTPPADSTGVAHILEHSVLAGSQKYPVRDAFNELGKGTLRTFLNAFTAPDFTCYPVASQVPADFRNLASVYTDLVFRPLLKEQTFMQEGHHLEVEEDGSLSISGIVYNEMKGAYSSAESVAQRATLQSLFPDTPYGVESGGDPDHIPDLTYEKFRDFHRRFYAPANARVFFYGDIPTAEHLAFLGEQFRGAGRVEVDSSVPLQPSWTAPREHRESFPAGPDEPTERKTIVNVAWLTAPMSDGEERFVLEVLAEALVGNAAGPLRKALVESGLG